MGFRDFVASLFQPIKRPAIGELTGVQMASGYAGGGKSTTLPVSYATYREMRKDPTIAMARALSCASVVAADWSVVADDDAPESWTQFIRDQFLPIREPLVETAMLGGIDFGNQPFEKVFAFKNGRVVLAKIKPLLQDLTEILVSPTTGALAGLRQQFTTVPLEKTLLIYFRVEGTNWWGQSLLENARGVWTQWKDANDGAARYDSKIAGSHFVVGFPPGSSFDSSGKEVHNSEIAATILRQLESSGSIATLRDMAPFADKFDVNNPGWDIRILEDNGGRQPTFVDRLAYLDVQKVRALLLPERTVLEGQHGTLAEAGAHLNFALTQAELIHRHITRLVNWHAVDQVLALNFGEEARGKVRLEASPLVDQTRAFLQAIYAAVLQNPSGFLAEFDQIDTDALKDVLGIPKSQEVADTGLSAQARFNLPGVDPTDRIAATVRRIYRDRERNGDVASQ